MMRYLVVLVLAVAATGCGDAGSACESAVRDAANISSTQDTVSDLDAAIEECASLADLEAAADQFPDALDGADVRTFVSNRCAAEPAIAETAICGELLTPAAS
jgi:hypothetical protein